MNNVPTEIIIENFEWEYWGTVELMKKYPIMNKFHWQYICDPTEEDMDQDVVRKITCIEDNGFDPWNRKLIPWKWRAFEEGKCWHTEIPHLYLDGKKKHAYSERYTTIEGRHLMLHKRLYDY